MYMMKPKLRSQALPQATKHYHRLPSTTTGCQALPKATKHYHRLPSTTTGYQALPQAAKHYQRLPSTTTGYQALPQATKPCDCVLRPKASHLRCMCMTCDTHTPGHPSVADEVWYWLKHVLCIG